MYRETYIDQVLEPVRVVHIPDQLGQIDLKLYRLDSFEELVRLVHRMTYRTSVAVEIPYVEGKVPSISLLHDRLMRESIHVRVRCDDIKANPPIIYVSKEAP